MRNGPCVLKSAENIKHLWYPSTGWNNSRKILIKTWYECGLDEQITFSVCNYSKQWNNVNLHIIIFSSPMLGIATKGSYKPPHPLSKYHNG